LKRQSFSERALPLLAACRFRWAAGVGFWSRRRCSARLARSDPAHDSGAHPAPVRASDFGSAAPRRRRRMRLPARR